MTKDAIYSAAQHLFQAAQNGEQGALLPEDIMPNDMTAAYSVQDALQAFWIEAGAGEIAGWKVALTSKVMQELVGVFRKQWDQFTGKIDSLGKSLTALSNHYDDLKGPRLRALEKPMDKISDLQLGQDDVIQELDK